MKINKRIFWFSLLGVGITSLVPIITFTNSYTNIDNEKNYNITQKESDYDLVKEISNKYKIDSSIVYSQEQAISIAKKMDNSEINFLNNFVKNQEIYFHNPFNNEIIVEKDFYTNWNFLTLNLLWNKQESQLISNLLGAISVGTGIAGLSNAEVPGVNLLLGVTSIATGSLSMVFSNPGNNGVKISLFLGFIPTYIGGY